MSFFSNLLHNEKKTEPVVLIDIGTSSVAGAYAYYIEGELPTIVYTRRLPVETREGEPQETAMLRALQLLGETLIREGAPVLARYTGSGAAETILVSVDAPWQSTSVRIEHFEQKDPFVFAKSLVTEELKKTSVATPGKMIADESIIGTILNGYETSDPYGKTAHRASVIVLTSLIDEKVAKSIRATLRGLYHAERVLPIAGSSLRYQATRRAFPHETDTLIIDATGPTTSIALVRKDLFVDAVEVADAPTSASWITGIRKELAELAKHYPLPRTIFLLARELEAPALQKTLDTAKLGELWLSDNPPKIVSVLASHLSGLVRQTSDAAPDLLLLLMALYWQHRAPEEHV